MRKIFLLSGLATVFVILAGCGTSSKVDKFVNSYQETDVIQKPIENYTGGTSSVSENIFLAGPNEVNSDGSYGEYTEYSSELLQNAIDSNKRVVIVVVDAECDNCKELDQSMSTSLSRIPSDVVVMKIPFSQAQSLYKVKEKNSVIYLNPDKTIKYLSDGGIRTVDNLVYYL